MAFRRLIVLVFAIGILLSGTPSWAQLGNAVGIEGTVNQSGAAIAGATDASVGHDNLFHGDRFRWSLRFTAINLPNKTALYNFLSTFSGTHYVTPASVDGGTRLPLLARHLNMKQP
jgi:hypothetical protein